MTQQPLQIEIVGSSLDDIVELLGTESLSLGKEIPLEAEAVLSVDDISKSSGFDATTVILTGLVTIATSTTTAILIEWLKSRLFASRPKSNITIIIDGKEIRITPGS